MLAMRWARDLSIRWKLVLIAVLTCAIAELFAGAAATYYSGTSYELQKRQDAEVQTNELAASLSAPLAFGDSSACSVSSSGVLVISPPRAGRGRRGTGPGR